MLVIISLLRRWFGVGEFGTGGEGISFVRGWEGKGREGKWVCVMGDGEMDEFWRDDYAVERVRIIISYLTLYVM